MESLPFRSEHDICAVAMGQKVIVAPVSIIGMLWLQMHWEEEYWDHFTEGSFILERSNAVEMIEDAEKAELVVIYE